MIISLDTEATGLDSYHGTRPFIVSTCDQNGVNTSWEWRVNPKTRMPVVRASDIPAICKVIKDAELLILQNAKFDYHILKTIIPNLEEYWDWGKVHDTLIGAHLLDSNKPKDLNTLSLRYLGIDITKYEKRMGDVVKKCRNLCKNKTFIEQYGHWKVAKKDDPNLPSGGNWHADLWLPKAMYLYTDRGDKDWKDLTFDYANADTFTTLKIWEVMYKRIQEMEMENIYNMRRKILGICADMERSGISAIKEELDSKIIDFTERSEIHKNRCINIAKTYDYDLVMPKNGRNNSLSQFVYGAQEFNEDGELIKTTNYINLPVIKTSKKTGLPSMDKGVMEQYLADLPRNSKEREFVKNVVLGRKLDTAISYMESYYRFGLSTEDQKYLILHCNMNICGTDTLRFSSDNPNSQNISKQEEYTLRSCFGPRPGREWYPMDYENIELRIPAYESGEQVMIDLFEKPDEGPYYGSYHLMNASIIYPDLFWPLANEKGAFKKKYASTWYQWCKNFGFAVQYGAVCKYGGTADKAAHKNGAHFLVVNRLSEHSKLNRKMIDMAKRCGYVETIPDKTVDPTKGYRLKCTLNNYGGILETVPLSYHIQSTAMWCTAKAMLRCDDYLKWVSKKTGLKYYMTAQVHDEIVFDFPALGRRNLPIVKKCRELMEQSGDDISIPLRASVSYCPNNWAKDEKPDWLRI